MKLLGTLLIVFSLFISQTVTAQSTAAKPQDEIFYSVQLGTFNEALTQSDFESIRTYAYVYKRNNIVFIGGFKTLDEAQILLDKVKLRGFDDAQIVQRPLANDKTVYVVQVSTSNAGEAVPFSTYSKFGKLYTAPTNNLVRLMVGYYADKNDARIKLNELFTAGYKDAFIKSVKLPQINSVSIFDTGNSVMNNAIATKSVPEMQPEAITTPPSAAALPQSYATISVKEKRKSVIKLQETLKKLGTFSGDADGVYGKMTDAAYADALEKNKTLSIARIVAQKSFESNDFDDAATFMVLAQWLANTPPGDAIKFDALANLPEITPTKTDIDAALNWHAQTWKKLETWSMTSKNATQSYDALKVAYYKTLTHLEQIMNERNIKGEAATGAALSVLRNLSNNYLSKID